MAKFLIEVPHAATKQECIRAIQIFLSTGSHFLSNADWGCGDGDHKAWIVVDVDDREDARRIVPPAYRANARIIRLEKFTMDQVEGMIGQHER